MSRPVVMHLLTRWCEADTSVSLITSTTATRALIVAASEAAMPPPAVARDAMTVVIDLDVAALRRLGSRRRARLVHAHDPVALSVAIEVAKRLGVPLVATFERADLDAGPGEPALASCGLLLVSSEADSDELLGRGVPADRVRVMRGEQELGARAAELDAYYLALVKREPLRPAATVRSTLPTVTVVVPTFNRKELVEQTVEAILAQTYPAELTQVVVVDDFSTDGTAETLAARYGAAITVVRPEVKRHAAGARNRGVAEATGEIVAFTDDDCRPVPEWLEALVAGFDDGVDVVQGRTIPDPAQRRGGRTRAISTPREYGLYETANLAFRRSALIAAGEPPFDPDLPDELRRVLGRRLGSPGTGEDSDLAWRVKRLGGLSRFAAYATVHHEVTQISRRGLLREAIRAAGFPLLVRRVPELRKAFLWRRYFVRRSHAAVVLAVLSLIAMVGSWYAAVGVLPYLWLLVGPTRRGRRRLRGVPLRVFFDLTEVLGCVMGSIYARRLVL